MRRGAGGGAGVARTPGISITIEVGVGVESGVEVEVGTIVVRALLTWLLSGTGSAA
ncbi:hypothetical protein [Streptomyces sp. NBC_00005]|uniref:hypothetical protein n=1 Tax=Streptomyces sp. NBC_00005 TaxID=2903609 RepID=UPI003247DE51